MTEKFLDRQDRDPTLRQPRSKRVPQGVDHKLPVVRQSHTGADLIPHMVGAPYGQAERLVVAVDQQGFEQGDSPGREMG